MAGKTAEMGRQGFLGDVSFFLYGQSNVPAVAEAAEIVKNRQDSTNGMGPDAIHRYYT